MNENFESKKIDEEVPAKPEHLSVKYMGRLQKKIIEKLGIENDMDRIEAYGKFIRPFVEDPANNDLRQLIFQEKYDEAADIVVEEIRRKEAPQKAA